MKPDSSAFWASRGGAVGRATTKVGQDGILLRDFVSDRPSGLPTRRSCQPASRGAIRVFYESKIRSRAI
jgi:hypothetical protein